MEVTDVDFTEVKETEAPSSNLMDRLTAVTEKKDPGAKAAPTWDFSEDKTDSEESDAGNSDFDTPPEKPKAENKPEEKEKPKLTDKMKLANARITVSALNSTQRIIFTPLINRKYRKKFEPEEIEKFDKTNIIDLPLDQVPDEDKSLRNKFDRIMEKRDKKIADIPFTPEESDDLEKMFYQYMDAKETSLPPEIMLVIGITNVIGKRAIDLCTD